MADTLNHYSVSASSSSKTIAGATSSAYQIILKHLSISNASTAALSVYVQLDGKNLVPGKSVSANDSLSINLTHVLNATKLLTGYVTTASTAVDILVSGIEVV
jgi:hypothetical protein